MLLWSSAFSTSSVEVKVEQIEVEGFESAYLISGPGISVGPLFAFTREQTEEIAQALEEKELLEADFETLNLYATELEVYNDQLEESKSRLRRWNTGLVAGLLGITAGLLTYSLLK